MLRDIHSGFISFSQNLYFFQRIGLQVLEASPAPPRKREHGSLGMKPRQHPAVAAQAGPSSLDQTPTARKLPGRSGDVSIIWDLVKSKALCSKAGF